MRRPAALIAILGAALAIAPACAQKGPAGTAGACTAAVGPAAGRGEDPRPGLLEELNRRRAARGVVPLRFSDPLCAAAAKHADALVRRGDLMPEFRDLERMERETAAAGARSDRLLLATVQVRADPVATWDALAIEHPSIGREALAGDLVHFGAGLARYHGQPIATLLFSLPRTETQARLFAPFADPEAMRRELLDATNRARLDEGLPALAVDPVLTLAAQSYAEAMLTGKFYSHVGPGGRDLKTRLSEVEYAATAVGENLARGLFSPGEVVERWLASPGHRRNILSPQFRSIGLGISYDPAAGDQSVHWVQIFSSR